MAELKKKLSVEEVEMRQVGVQLDDTFPLTHAPHHPHCQSSQRRVGVEAELKEVQPMIDEARKAVGQIKKENIDEIRSLKMPPDAIRDVLEVGALVVSWFSLSPEV